VTDTATMSRPDTMRMTPDTSLRDTSRMSPTR
jgi:hypothetical protein